MQENSFLQSDDALSRLGLDPSQPFYELNLAGTQGVPAPQTLARPTSPPLLIPPDFGTQSYEVPPVQHYDLTGPGITYVPALATDPMVPDLDAYNHPYSLDLITQGMEPDSQLAHDIPTASEIASSLYPGLGFSALDVHCAGTDSLIPALHYPDLTQQTQMPRDERPGDLDAAALDVMHGTPSYQQASDSTYPEAWMKQGGVNTTRTRHMSLLNDGLDV